MKEGYVVTGTLTDRHTGRLDEDLPSSLNRVRLTVEAVDLPAKSSPMEVLDRIHARMRSRGYTPPTREEVDEYLRKERESWER
jgi:hypothetical protein